VAVVEVASTAEAVAAVSMAAAVLVEDTHHRAARGLQGAAHTAVERLRPATVTAIAEGTEIIAEAMVPTRVAAPIAFTAMVLGIVAVLDIRAAVLAQLRQRARTSVDRQSQTGNGMDSGIRIQERPLSAALEDPPLAAALRPRHEPRVLSVAVRQREVTRPQVCVLVAQMVQRVVLARATPA